MLGPHLLSVYLYYFSRVHSPDNYGKPETSLAPWPLAILFSSILVSGTRPQATGLWTRKLFDYLPKSKRRKKNSIDLNAPMEFTFACWIFASNIKRLYGFLCEYIFFFIFLYGHTPLRSPRLHLHFSLSLSHHSTAISFASCQNIKSIAKVKSFSFQQYLSDRTLNRNKINFHRDHGSKKKKEEIHILCIYLFILI